MFTSREFREKAQEENNYQFTFTEAHELKPILSAISRGDLCEAKKEKALSTILSQQAEVKGRRLIAQMKTLKQKHDQAEKDDKSKYLSAMDLVNSQLSLINLGVLLKSSRLIKL